MGPRKLLLVTSSYPDAQSKEKSFVYPELVELVRAGFAVTLMPVRACGAIDPDLPAGVMISSDLSRRYQQKPFIRAIAGLLSRMEFWSEILARPKLVFRFRFWKDSLRAAISSAVFRRLAGSYDIFYTYWFSGETTGMSFAGVSPVISRAHGYDLYVERVENKGWIPYRKSDLAHLRRLIVLSERVRTYIEHTYAFDHFHAVVSPLGVEDRQPAPFDIARIGKEVLFFSCAFPSTVKRLPLIFQFVASFAAMHPDKRVRWVHIGARFQEIVDGGRDERFPENLIVDARGHQSNEYVQEFMASTQITFFVNLSVMEGLPVSIMEALAFGIPAIATDVGCVADLLDDGAGLLISVDVTPNELSDLVSNVLSSPAQYLKMRDCAARTQRARYNGRRNHAALAKSLFEKI